MQWVRMSQLLYLHSQTRQSRLALKTASDTGKAKRVSDGGGLYLDAGPNGAGWWRLRYWIASKEGMLSLGTYPDTGLRDARIRRDAARKLVAAGTDPSDQRKADKQAAAARASFRCPRRPPCPRLRRS